MKAASETQPAQTVTHPATQVATLPSPAETLLTKVAKTMRRTEMVFIFSCSDLMSEGFGRGRMITRSISTHLLKSGSSGLTM